MIVFDFANTILQSVCLAAYYTGPTCGGVLLNACHALLEFTLHIIQACTHSR